MDLQTLKYAEEWISRQVDQGEFPFATLKVYIYIVVSIIS